jgi:hypothetical protein
LCDSDAPHIISASAGYDLPFGAGHRLGGGATGVVDQLISGWRVNTIFTYRAVRRSPFRATPRRRRAGLQRGADRSAVVPRRPQLPGMAQPGGRSRIRLSPRRSVQTDLSPMGGDPTQVRGPDFKRLDLSVFKGFRGAGQQRFEVRMEIFNLTNTHNFSVPGFSGGGAGLPPPPGVLDLQQHANFG